MPTIRIDDELYDFLKAEAEPFVDTPNTVLRRLVGLPTKNGPEATEDVIDQGPEASRRSRRKSGQARRQTRSSTANRARGRARKGSLLASEEYEGPILQLIAQRGGQAPAREVIDALEERLDGQLTSVDRERLRSGGVRWRNRAQFVRLDLINRGEMVADSPRGIWELTDAGRQRAEGR